MARRFLLTSGGITNPTLQQALAELLGTPFSEAAVAYIPTAALAEPGDHSWLLESMNRVHALGWREFDVLDLNGLPTPVVADRLRHADVVLVEGGNHYHLARSITRNGLTGVLLEALETRVYVGVSAGSMIFSRHLTAHSAEVVGDVAALHLLDADTVEPPFGLFDWYLKPHLHSPGFPERDDAWADRITARADFPIWFIDDDTAIRIRADALDVVSEGSWRRPDPGGDGLLPD